MAAFVIAGGGLAAAKAAETLRDEGFDGEIVLVGAEPDRPYERPPLSKGYLLGSDERDSVYVHSRDWYAEHQVDLRQSVTVTAIDRAAATVTTAGPDGPRTLPYDKLLLATGAAPRRLSFPGSESDEVLYLRTLADSDRLRAAFQPGTRVVVAGAGWIGLETAAAARTADCHVTVLEPEPAPLHAQVEHAVEFRAGPGGRDGIVITSAGAKLAADVMVIGIGAAPNEELAARAGLEVSGGVVTDEALRTSDPNIFAAGDVARSFSPLLGRRIRVEHWANALNGGPAAAKSMLGQPVVYDPVPYFYSDQYELGMECSGLPELGSYDQVAYRGDPKTLEFIAFWLSGGAVIAGMNVNVWDVTDDIQALVRSRGKVDVGRLTDLDIPLSDI
jgi:NADPH-dependent 2,4-dienoyl-CoA reductase/sulfur reductase-like enzyme